MTSARYMSGRDPPASPESGPLCCHQPTFLLAISAVSQASEMMKPLLKGRLVAVSGHSLATRYLGDTSRKQTCATPAVCPSDQWSELNRGTVGKPVKTESCQIVPRRAPLDQIRHDPTRRRPNAKTVAAKP